MVTTGLMYMLILLCLGVYATITMSIMLYLGIYTTTHTLIWQLPIYYGELTTYEQIVFYLCYYRVLRHSGRLQLDTCVRRRAVLRKTEKHQ